MIRRLHPIAGGIAIGTILIFWTSTVAVELFGDGVMVAAVKTAILWGLLLLIPAIAFAGASGFRLGGNARSPLIAAKRRRMPVIALNGLLVLVPCAFFLQARATAGRFDTAFVAVQMLELAAGAVNIALLALSVRDGRRLAGIRRRQLTG